MTDYTELIKALLSASTVSTAWEKLMRDAADAIEALQAQLPKRGGIVRCEECIHFTQGGWCDREFDWFPVDENDFCSMAEKMEAQE